MMNSIYDLIHKDDLPMRCVGRALMEVLTETLEIKPQLHSWLPPGLTLLGGKTKSGKSTLAEQIAEEISENKKVLYLALEYNKRMAQGRFKRFTEKHQIHLVLEGEMNRIGNDGEKELEALLFHYKPKLVIVDILAKIKRKNNGYYDEEYKAMTEIKELIDQFDIDCLVLTHSGKPSGNDSDDPFDKIIGSTALQGVPDNLMVLEQSKGQTKLHTKGRLIYPSEKVLSFKDGRYEERAGVSAEYEYKAPVQALVIKELEKSPKTVKELSDTLGKDKGQISNVCSSLEDDGKISRSNRSEPWYLVETSFKT
jgi:hypothetical protein